MGTLTSRASTTLPQWYVMSDYPSTWSLLCMDSSLSSMLASMGCNAVAYSNHYDIQDANILNSESIMMPNSSAQVTPMTGHTHVVTMDMDPEATLIAPGVSWYWHGVTITVDPKCVHVTSMVSSHLWMDPLATQDQCPGKLQIQPSVESW